MKRTCSLFQQYIAYVLLVSFFLQSCNGLNHLITPIEKEPTTSISTLLPTNIETVIGQELVAQGGHIVTCYQEDGKLKADVAMNLSQGFSKTYEGLNVAIEQGAELDNLSRLDEKLQQRRIEFHLSQGSQTAKVVIYKGAGLMGGSRKKEKGTKAKGKNISDKSGKNIKPIEQGEEPKKKDKYEKKVKSKKKKKASSKKNKDYKNNEKGKNKKGSKSSSDEESSSREDECSESSDKKDEERIKQVEIASSKLQAARVAQRSAGGTRNILTVKYKDEHQNKVNYILIFSDKMHKSGLTLPDYKTANKRPRAHSEGILYAMMLNEAILVKDNLEDNYEEVKLLNGDIDYISSSNSPCSNKGEHCAEEIVPLIFEKAPQIEKFYYFTDYNAGSGPELARIFKKAVDAHYTGSEHSDQASETSETVGFYVLCSIPDSAKDRTQQELPLFNAISLDMFVELEKKENYFKTGQGKPSGESFPWWRNEHGQSGYPDQESAMYKKYNPQEKKDAPKEKKGKKKEKKSKNEE
ncbi:MAG: hypothetical protein ACYC2U_07290 [Candidatus Amoebophilus sp.]